MHTLIQDYTNKSPEMEILAEYGLCALSTIKDFFSPLPFGCRMSAFMAKVNQVLTCSA